MRGGTDYREHCCGPDQEPWPANLCTGVREWTATSPRLLGRSSGLDPATECRTYLPLFLSPCDALARGDLDGDSVPEIVSTHFDEDVVRVHWGRPAGRAPLELRTSALQGPRHVLVAEDGAPAGVIDWGAMGVGDPACDVMVAWKLHSGAARDTFRSAVAEPHGRNASQCLVHVPFLGTPQ